MPQPSLREIQAPLKDQYRTDPSQAKITLRATGAQQEDFRSCSVDIGRALYEASLHEGAGGPGAGACSGDLLLGALAACAQLTAQAITNAFGLEADVQVEVEGDLDLRGTLGVEKEVPVGFEDIRLRFHVDGDLDEDARAALQKYTERFCVVYQTLTTPPRLNTAWDFE